MPTQVSIANSALTKIGAELIVSLDDPVKTARYLKVLYHPSREKVSRMHAWKCLTRRDSIAADSTVPKFGYARQFTLPSDCLKVLPLASLEGLSFSEYSIEGRKLLTNLAAPLRLIYIASVESANDYDSLFSEALSTYLAWELSFSIVQEPALRRNLERQFHQIMRHARHHDALEGGIKALESTCIEEAWVGADYHPVGTSSPEIGAPLGAMLTQDGQVQLTQDGHAQLTQGQDNS